MLIPLLSASILGGEIMELISQTGLVAKAVLVILLVFSVVSWAIILAKWSLFSRAKVQSSRFVRAFRRANRFQDISAVAEQFKPSPLVAVFEAGIEEVRRQGGVVRNLVGVQRAMQVACSEELTRLERRLPWLASTGAVTPFIGLFGTVWGIIDAFQGLGTAGAATLRAVAPGISEALITTAAGLFAAIPAVIAYNHMLAEIRQFGARMDDFSLEMLNTMERSMMQPLPRGAAAVQEPEYRT
ncbi:MAG TPA: MotA/TolQ/ExbB proton channel family protein [Terriglobales bacterium]|nr:MotA/TolQ/ExbB proton channel family protein [Terriglobales bacterium]